MVMIRRHAPGSVRSTRSAGSADRFGGFLAAAAIAVLTASGPAFAAPGDLDPSFWGTGRHVLELFAFRHGAVLPDGRVVAQTSNLNVISATAAESFPLDLFEGFGGGRLVALSDGRVAAVEVVFDRERRGCLRATRLSAAFALDPTFGGGDGVVEGACFGPDLHGYAVYDAAVGRNNDLYVVGHLQTSPTAADQNFFAVVSANGTKVRFVPRVGLPAGSIPSSALHSIVVRPESGGGETLWVAGVYDASRLPGVPDGSWDWNVARVDAFGALAPGFSAPRTFRLGDQFVALASAPGGGVYVGGTTQIGPRSMRVYSVRGDGTLVPHFGGPLASYASFEFEDGFGGVLAGLATKPGHEGGVYVSGGLYRFPADGGDRTVVLALDGAGVVDAGFGSSGGGRVFLEPPYIGARVAPVPDGIFVSGSRLVVLDRFAGGWFNLMGYYDSYVTRLLR
jgi:hypothetical protein